MRTRFVDYKNRQRVVWLFNGLIRLPVFCGSGNMSGDSGARMLSKALLMNKKLATVYWDRNGTSPQGFSDIAAALERSRGFVC